MDTALAIVVGIVIAVVSAYITAHLSLAKFRTERWWERRAEAYSKIIETLYRSKAYAENYLDAKYGNREIPEKDENKLREHSEKALEKINMSVGIGAFLLSDEALEKLKKFQRRHYKTPRPIDFMEFLEDELVATNKCLNALIEIAKNDLQTK